MPHEISHYINSIFENVNEFGNSIVNTEKARLKVVEAYDTNNPESFISALDEYASELVQEANNSIMDEIIASITDGTNIKDIKTKLLNTSYNFYNKSYKTFADTALIYANSGHVDINKIGNDPKWKDIFSDTEYSNTISNSLNHFEEIRAKRYSTLETITILRDKPLNTWGNIVTEIKTNNFATRILTALTIIVLQIYWETKYLCNFILF
jgi:hypothetical protein